MNDEQDGMNGCDPYSNYCYKLHKKKANDFYGRPVLYKQSSTSIVTTQLLSNYCLTMKPFERTFVFSLFFIVLKVLQILTNDVSNNLLDHIT